MKARIPLVSILLLFLTSACGVQPATPAPDTPVSPTPTATPIPTEISLPLPWPLSLSSAEQVDEARNCAIESLVTERYPDALSLVELADAYPAETACDWAVLAVAYAGRVDKDEPLPPEGERALAQALARNPALALRDAVLYTYYGTLIVSVPPVAEKRLAQARIGYHWFGLGDPMEVTYAIDVVGADLTVSGTVGGTSYSGTVPQDKFEAMGKALTDLVPIQQDLPPLVPCTDNDTHWDVTLTYDDGTIVELTNNGSNVIGAGGPWQVTINGQKYFQFSSAFLIALADLVDAIEMPWGEPYGSYCHGLDAELIDQLFP